MLLNLLRAHMVANCDDVKRLAAVLNISRQSLQRRLRGETPFKPDEIAAIRARYHINNEEAARIFL